MAQPSALPQPITLPAIPLREIAPWAVLMVLLSFAVLYFVSSEQGAMSMFSGAGVHEFLHDGRHLLGFPCH
jgi:Probable cobalt transporter subunit (CbtB)